MVPGVYRLRSTDRQHLLQFLLCGGTDRLYRWVKLRERFDLLLAVGGFGFFAAMAASYLHFLLK